MRTLRDRISRLTDNAFEEFASSLLRRAESRYRRLQLCGLNSRGQSRKSPVDGICRLFHLKPPVLILFQFTTTNIKTLQQKWLDPKKGDLPKALRVFGFYRSQIPNLTLEVVLGFSAEPHERIQRSAIEFAKGQFELDFWGIDRMSDFAAIDPEGQLVAAHYLGVPATLLSASLLQELGAASIEHGLRFTNFGREGPLVKRNIDAALADHLESTATPLVAVHGDSGLGKSTTVLSALRILQTRGHYCLWGTRESLANARSVEQLIESLLRDLDSSLDIGSGKRALDLADTAPGLILALDGIDEPHLYDGLMRRLLALPPESQANRTAAREDDRPLNAAARKVKIVAPISTRIWGQTDARARAKLESGAFSCPAFTHREATDAVIALAEASQWQLSKLDSSQIANALGSDILLIALWAETGFSMAITQERRSLIDGFIHNDILEVSSKTSLSPATLKHALAKLAHSMLINSQFSPSLSWLATAGGFEKDELHALERLAQTGRIIGTEGDTDSLIFRHSRVRETFLARAAVELLQSGATDVALLSDPYLGNLLAEALRSPLADSALIEVIANRNPLAALLALQSPLPECWANQAHVVRHAQDWCMRVGTLPRHHPDRRLAEAQLPHIDRRFSLLLAKEIQSPSFSSKFARFRGGDTESAISFLGEISLGHAVLGSSEARLSVAQGGPEARNEIVSRLRDPSSSLRTLHGSLHLVGYLSDRHLAELGYAAWRRRNDSSDPVTLGLLLWALLRSAEPSSPGALEEVFGAWRSLGDEPAGERFELSPRAKVSMHTLEWAILHNGLPDWALARLAAEMHGELSTLVASILRQIDSPLALLPVARLAASDPNYWWHLSSDWHPTREGRLLGADSRSALRELLENPREPAALRREAYFLWRTGLNAQDLDVLKKIDPSEKFFADVVRARAQLGDISVLPLLVEQIEAEEFPEWNWRYAHRIWEHRLKVALGTYIQIHLGDASAEAPPWLGDESARLLMRIPTADTEEIFQRYWPQLSRVDSFKVAALHSDSEWCQSAASTSIRESENPTEAVSKTRWCWGYGFSNPQVPIELRHLERLAEFIHLLDDKSFDSLWRYCNSSRYFAWRRRHLDTRLPKWEAPDISHWPSHQTNEGASLCLQEYTKTERGFDRFFAERWTEEFEERGESTATAAKVLLEHLAHNRGQRELEFACYVVDRIGEREYLSLISTIRAESEELEHLVEWTRVSVCRRSAPLASDPHRPPYNPEGRINE